MGASDAGIKSNLGDDSSIELENIVENIINRIRICFRVICCMPFDRIIPSEIFTQKSYNTCQVKPEVSQTRTAKEIRFEMQPKSKTNIKEKNKVENSVYKLTSKSLIRLKDNGSKDSQKILPKTRSILKESKCENEEIPAIIDLAEKKLKFESSEKKLQGKKARCRLFKSHSKRLKKMGTEMNDLVTSKRKKKSSTSVKSSENDSKCKKTPKIHHKTGKKLIKKEKSVLLKFVCADSLHALWQGPTAVPSPGEDSGGDAPAKHRGIPPRVLNYTKNRNE